MSIVIILVSLTNVWIIYAVAQVSMLMETDFGQALGAINRAEAMGAASNQTAPLVNSLNTALALEQEALNLPANQTQKRDALMSEARQILVNVTSQANDISTTAAQMSYVSTITAYATGLMLAIVGTLVYAFADRFHFNRKIKT